ncbi:MAG: hypothetical protein J0H60_01505 [Rhizobiales bacterium]|nr:hypothetical protein [Hyphomicrobiales bacterium]
MLRVVTPPTPIVSPSDLSGGYAADDARALGVIAAVTEMIDGPTSWLGRAIGPQTLELSLESWHTRHHHHHWHSHPHSIFLPCPPIIAVESVVYLDLNGDTQTIDPTNYAVTDNLLWFKPGWTMPTFGCFPDPLRVQYKAGYNGTSGAAAGEQQTGDIPARVKQAIILTAQHMLNTASENLFLSVDEVDGVGRQQYVVSDLARQTIETTCDRLLAGLRVYAA